jgi:hypothetical protein
LWWWCDQRWSGYKRGWKDEDEHEEEESAEEDSFEEDDDRRLELESTVLGPWPLKLIPTIHHESETTPPKLQSFPQGEEGFRYLSTLGRDDKPQQQDRGR